MRFGFGLPDRTRAPAIIGPPGTMAYAFRPLGKSDAARWLWATASGTMRITGAMTCTGDAGTATEGLTPFSESCDETTSWARPDLGSISPATVSRVIEMVRDGSNMGTAFEMTGYEVAVPGTHAYYAGGAFPGTMTNKRFVVNWYVGIFPAESPDHKIYQDTTGQFYLNMEGVVYFQADVVGDTTFGVTSFTTGGANITLGEVGDDTLPVTVGIASVGSTDALNPFGFNGELAAVQYPTDGTWMTAAGLQIDVTTFLPWS